MPLTLPKLPSLALFPYLHDDEAPASPAAAKPPGMKFDGGKLQHHLVDVAAHNEMVAVLTHGAVKYSSIEERCTCGASAGRLLDVEDFVEPATTRNSGDGTRSMPSGSERTRRRGGSETENESPRTSANESRTKTRARSVRGTTERSTGSRSSTQSGSFDSAARSADRSSDYGSITVTRGASSADASVTRATSGSGSWSVPGTGLRGHSPTCKANTWISGAGNWQRVEGWEDRYFDAALRHLLADRAGAHVDEDAGLLALAVMT